VLATMADHEALTRRLFLENNNVKHFRAFVAVERVKAGLELPTFGSRRGQSR
jgi:Lrp/AsnC family leucine-responsive transcriptional regulator